MIIKVSLIKTTGTHMQLRAINSGDMGSDKAYEIYEALREKLVELTKTPAQEEGEKRGLQDG